MATLASRSDKLDSNLARTWNSGEDHARSDDVGALSDDEVDSRLKGRVVDIVVEQLNSHLGTVTGRNLVGSGQSHSEQFVASFRHEVW